MSDLHDAIRKINPSIHSISGDTYEDLVCIGGEKPSSDEIEIAIKEIKISKLASRIRQERDTLLQETDFTQLEDAPIPVTKKQAYKEYRQALRDITLQEGFPENVIFPEKP